MQIIAYHALLLPHTPLLLPRHPAPICCEPPRQPGQLGGRIPESQSQSDEYLEALADAQRAAARLKQAERKLVESTPIPRPRGARATITRSDAGTLLVDLPPGGLNVGTAMGGAFSAAWFAVVVPATFASGGAGALFMLPFWIAGGAVAKQTVLDPAKATALSIGEFAWDLRQSLVGQLTLSSEGGPTEELEGADVDVAAYVNGVPMHRMMIAAGGGKAFGLGDGLDVGELEWIASEVNAHLRQMEARRST